MKRCIQKNEKIIKRELRHKDWLERNMKHSQQLRKTKKQLLKLHTEVAFAKQEK